MTRTARPLAAAVALAALLCPWAGAAHAQDRTVSVQVTPTIGWYTPLQTLSPVPEDGDPVATRVEPAPVFGLAAEAGLGAAPFVGLRLGVRYAPSELALQRPGGFRSCGQDCARAVHVAEHLAPASLLFVTADVMLRGPRLAAVQPFLAAGGGVKHYAFGQGELEGEAARVFAEDETRRTLHLGLGLDARWRRTSLVAEVGNYLSSFGEAVPSPVNPNRIDRGALQHDLFLSVGARVPLF